jgi:prepilin peptidase CpaA
LNLLAGAPLWLDILFACAMVAAAIEDAARLRISNLISILVLAGAIAAMVIVGPAWSLWQNLAVFAALLVLGTGAFAAGWMGGGDVKLFAAAGLWFGFFSAISFVTFVLLAGGLVAIGYLMARPFRREADKKSRRVPYGIAIAIGALAMVLVSREAPSARSRAFSPITAPQPGV